MMDVWPWPALCATTTSPLMFSGLVTIGFDDGRLFNPRKDNWDDHFVFDPVTLQLRGRTAEGQGTVNRLRMNDAIQIEARRHWVELDLYP
jgi:hypothetical protein